MEEKKLAAELIIANKELAFQNEEKEKRAAELIIANYARSLIEASLDPLVTISAAGKILDVNEASVKVTGVLREKLIDTDFSNYFTEPTKAQEGYRQVFEKGFVADYPLTIKHKNGNLTDVLYNASVYKDDKGNVLGVFAAARDVTEQKWAKDLRIANKELAFQNDEKEKRASELSIANKELNQSERLLKESLKEMSDYKDALDETAIIALTDQKGIIRKANANFCKISKYSKEELIGQDHRLLNSGYHPKEFIHDLWETIANGKIWKGEIKNKAKDGSFYWVDTTIVPFLNEQGKPYQYLAIRVDITKRKESEEQLKTVNIELAFQNNEKEKRAAELGIANKELIFQNDQKEKRAAELGVANKKLVFENEEKEKRAAELVIANKELAFQNEEKEKRAAELIIANKELVFQNEEKEKRAAELGIANKELESFTYISSHDLQEPLRKIQIFATRLIADESKNLSDKGKKYVLRMQDAANRMQVLITDLLAYSRTTTSERKFETTDLNTIIESVKKDFAETIAEKKAIIKVNEMCDADIIPFQFRQLMHNIIGNALKFSKPDLPPQILIKNRIIKGSKVNNQKLLSEKEYCHITITDNGIGFEPQYKDHIFELFKRLHDKEKITGTGIGLTIVKRIVENHNGVIVATSELNKGATFDIYIPST